MKENIRPHMHKLPHDNLISNMYTNYEKAIMLGHINKKNDICKMNVTATFVSLQDVFILISHRLHSNNRIYWY